MDYFFKDEKLSDRFKKIVEALASCAGKTIPQVCDEWAMTKATYRFLSNEKVEDSEILGSHFKQTSKRIEACDGPILILLDTTEFSHIVRNSTMNFQNQMPLLGEKLLF